MKKNKQSILNRSVWITTVLFAVLVAISGIHHGIFEILQGNTSTENFIIQSVGVEQQRWMNGEEAFTLLHNFLITGIAAILVSCAIIYWSVFHLNKSTGPSVLLLLFILLTLVGGGIVHILYFLPVWIYSSRIRRDISWRKSSPGTTSITFLSQSWVYLLIFTALLFLSALEFSLFGIPGASEKTISTVIFSGFLLGLLTLNLSFLAAFARDIKVKKINSGSLIAS